MEALLAGVQLAKDETWRAEDIQQRQLENEYRRIEDARRSQDMKSEQLKAISNLAALIAGFGMVFFVEANLPNDLTTVSPPLLWFFGGLSTLVVGLNLLCVMITSLMLVAVLNFDCNASVKAGAQTFDQFWELRCQRDWQFAFRAFIYTVPLFLADIGVATWLLFPTTPIASIIITCVAGLCLIVLTFYAFPVWAGMRKPSLTPR